MKDLSISNRILFTMGAVLVLMAALVAIAVQRVGVVSDRLMQANDVNSVKQRYAINFRGSVHDRAISLRDVTLVATLADAKKHLDDIQKLADNYGKSAGPLDAMFAQGTNISEAERAALDKIKQIERQTLPMIAKVVELRLAGNEPEAKAFLLQQASPAFSQWLAAINVLIDLEESMNAKLSAEVTTITSGFRWLMIGLLFTAVAVGLLASWRTTRVVAKGLSGAARMADHIGNGDLNSSTPVQRDDEIGRLMNSLQKAQSSLVSTVQQIRLGTESITTASAEIAAGTQDLSTRTEQAASNLQQTASSMEELTAAVRQTADSARTANQLASSAQASAAKGGQIVSQFVTTMEDINASSKKISDIIGVIDGIAFQTNILALNAAVEAARAGEQGRGFAVVASEVRSLAQRSANAAKEIKGLIGASVDKVESGSKLVADAGQTMSEIVGSVQRVSDIIGEITAAAAEQSNGIGHVNTAVSTLDQMTQQNAALVEQSTAAAESLKDQAGRLASSVSIFKIDGGQAAKPAAARALPAPTRPAAAAFRPAAAPARAAAPAAAASSAKRAPAPAPAAPKAVAAAAAGGDWETF